MEFIDHIQQRLTNNGYRCHRANERPLGDLFVTVDGGRTAWVCYLDAPIESEDIRKALQFPGYLLFVVNEKLIPDEIESREATPMWLRVLHGLYMGRIYVWNGRYLFGLHFDYDTGDVSESSIIDPTDLLLVETGTWLRGWTDIYRLARFYDRAWWTGNSWEDVRTHYGDAHHRQQKNRQSQEDFRRQHYGEWRRPEDEPRYRDWQPPGGPPPYEPPKEQAKRDFLSELLKCGTLSKARLKYRALAKEFHPDLTGRDTNAEMQQVNAAWEKAQRMMA